MSGPLERLKTVAESDDDGGLGADIVWAVAAIKELESALAACRNDRYQQFLQWRNIETPCKKCQGTGSVTYSSTAMWRGGIGGSMLTLGVCDHCWGSGDEHRHWTDLRKLEDKS